VADEVGIDGLHANLPQHRGNLTQAIRGMIRPTLHLLEEELGAMLFFFVTPSSPHFVPIPTSS
jgi:hypothetical protein